MSKNFIAAAALVTLLCACSRTHTVTTQDGSVSVEQGKDGTGSVHAVGKDGTSMDINTGKKITDYPAEVPLYEGKSVMDIKSGEKNSRVVMVTTKDSMDKISEFYKSQLESKGWKIEATMNMDKMVMYKGSKDNRDLVIQIQTDGNGQQSISQTLANK